MQVLIVEGLSGNEDIPEGVVAVLTGSATDVLSHIAIRARSQVRRGCSGWCLHSQNCCGGGRFEA